MAGKAGSRADVGEGDARGWRTASDLRCRPAPDPHWATKCCLVSIQQRACSAGPKAVGSRGALVDSGVRNLLGNPRGWGRSCVTERRHRASLKGPQPRGGGAPAPGAMARHPSPSRSWNPQEERQQAVGSGSQQEACPRPLEPQEGDQAPREGGGEGVDEFL